MSIGVAILHCMLPAATTYTHCKCNRLRRLTRKNRSMFLLLLLGLLGRSVDGSLCKKNLGMDHFASHATWQVARDASGRQYWYNTATGQTSWTDPTMPPPPPEPVSAAHGLHLLMCSCPVFYYVSYNRWQGRKFKGNLLQGDVAPT